MTFAVKFSSLRKDLFEAVKRFIPRVEYASNDAQLKTLLSDEKAVIPTGIFLYKALTLRKFLINEPKNVI